ncbi:MAG: UTP--glucose-1-phosphate uridylyltransferase [Spirochaetaceae bacterium]
MNNINYELSNTLLKLFNDGEIGQEPKVVLQDLPNVDNINIFDLSNDINIAIDEKQVNNFFNKFNLPPDIFIECKLNNFYFNSELLEKIGIYLYPTIAFGVLNGGSATSYVDISKNRGFNEELHNNLSEVFKDLTSKYKGKAKGITPAYINPDGSPGVSFMELKFRSLLLESKKYNDVTGLDPKNLFPIFQMTSSMNNEEINSFYDSIKDSPMLKELIKETNNNNISNVYSGIQPLITAFTHSSVSDKKEIFKDSDGENLALPGGHGQCFLVLKQIFKDLLKKGVYFITLGNVDNIGYSIDPKTLALLALTGKQATFDFSYKTQFDVKGGILIKDQFGKLNCADIGVAVSKNDLEKAQESGKPILFNCATGMFSLEYLVNNLDDIILKLPTRFSDQNKDIGLYSQAEQVTWEIISLLDDFMIMAVNKYDRFLASKLLLENLVTSGFATNITNIELKNCAKELNKGLLNILENKLNLKIINGKWV